MNRAFATGGKTVETVDAAAVVDDFAFGVDTGRLAFPGAQAAGTALAFVNPDA